MTRKAMSILFLLAFASRARARQRGTVFFPAQLFDGVKNRAENIRLVIRDGRAEVGEIFCALEDAGHALETHAGVHVLGGQRRKRAVGIRVELDENEVPDLDALGTAFVHQRALGVALLRKINVQFAARAARAGFAHHPEIVFAIARNDVNHWVLHPARIISSAQNIAASWSAIFNGDVCLSRGMLLRRDHCQQFLH